jgi:HSP20 family protein
MAANVPVKTGQKTSAPTTAVQTWRPFESLRREIDRVFEDFDGGFWPSSFPRSLFDGKPFERVSSAWNAPAVDIVEKEKSHEISAELPGLDEKEIEVNVANGGLTITGEKREEKEEKEKDYYLKERRYGSFKRYFALPDGVDADKIEASFKNGVLTVSLPKKPEAVQSEKKIEVKAAK